MLTQAQVDHYWSQGWLVVNGVFEHDRLDNLSSLAWDITQKEMADVATQKSLFDRDENGNPLPRKLHQPYLKHPDFSNVAFDETLAQMLTQLLGDSPCFATDQLFMKPPRHGSAKPYHQDNFYFECTPKDGVITAWIALDDVDEENGCLRYINGSHREGIIPHTATPGEPHNLAVNLVELDLSRESLAIVQKGGVVFHHGETLHTSHRNSSERWRRGYATHWVTKDVTSTAGVIDRAHYRQPSPF